MADQIQWQLSGDYFENCSCTVVCPCLVSSAAPLTSRPTEGVCDVPLIFHIEKGKYGGVSLDGLSVVVAVAGDRNLGIFEIGGPRANSRSQVFVDQNANAAQRAALVAMADDLAKDTIGTIVGVAPVPVQFVEDTDSFAVTAGPQLKLDISKTMDHDPGCGSQQWFHPLSRLDNATLGHTVQNAFFGTTLGTRWSDPDKHSAFFGTFSY